MKSSVKNADPPASSGLSFWNLFKEYYTDVSNDLLLLLKPALNLIKGKNSRSKDHHLDRKLDDDVLETPSTREIQTVMERLGIAYDPKQTFGHVEDISTLFELQQPNLEEMEQAFDVFDENRDGFIDGKDLYRVLLSLGLDVGSEMEAHASMIEAADKNGDGLVDFNEFVQFILEKVCFS